VAEAGALTLNSKQRFSPICDLHHTAMRRMMLEEECDDVHSFHACDRPGCTRVFRDFDGYSDLAGSEFDGSRGLLRTCPACGSSLYLAEVDHSRKVETWECPHIGCDFAEDRTSPSAQ
jgi:hypothetical protein